MSYLYLPYVAMETNTDTRVVERHNASMEVYGMSGKELNFEDRLLVVDLARVGASVREIARHLKRPALTVGRELLRSSDSKDRDTTHSGVRRGRQFKDPMVNISERLAEIEDGAIPGHWEGDPIVGAHSSSATGTLVELISRFALLLRLSGDHIAETVRDAIVRAVGGLYGLLQKSLTFGTKAQSWRSTGRLLRP